MSGEAKLTIEQCQARIQYLRKPENGGLEKNKAEIQKLTQMIQDAISGKAEKNGGKIAEGDVDISSEMGATFSAKQNVAGQDKIDRTKKHSGQASGKDVANENIKEEYGYRDKDGKLLSAMEAEEMMVKLDELKEKLEKDMKEAEKTWKKAMKANDEAKAAEAEAKYDELVAKYQEFKPQYDKDMAALRINAGKKGAIKGIRKAADQNVKHFEDVQTVAAKGTFKPEDLSNDELRALKQLQKYGQKQIAKAEASGDEKKIRDAHARYDHYSKMFDKDGNIDIKATQNVLVEYTGGDQNLNLDERILLKKRLNVGNSNFVSEGDVKDLYSKFGFGTESKLKGKAKAAAVAGGAALAGMVLNNLLGYTHDHDHQVGDPVIDEKTVTAEGETVTKKIHWTAPDGSEYKTTVIATGGTATATATAFAEATADACAKIPILGQLAGPVLAGVTAFILSNGSTENAFNSASVEAVLEDLSLVKNADNQAIINKIQDLPLDDRVKAAVLKAAMGEGVTANTAELESAYQDLLKAKEVIGQIQVTEEQETGETGETEAKPPVKPDQFDTEKESVRTELGRMKQKEGNWFVSFGYVHEDGSNLTEAERKAVQKALKDGENALYVVDTNGNKKADAGDKLVSLKNEIEITVNGKKIKVKLAPDARERIMKKEGAKDWNKPYKGQPYVIQQGMDGRWYVVNKTKGTRVAGPYDTEAAAAVKKDQLQQQADAAAEAANKPKTEQK